VVFWTTGPWREKEKGETQKSLLKKKMGGWGNPSRFDPQKRGVGCEKKSAPQRGKTGGPRGGLITPKEKGGSEKQ